MFPVGDLERNIPKNLIWAKGLGEIVDCQYCGWRHGLAKSSFGRPKRLLARHWQIDNSPASIALLLSRMSHHGLGKLLTLCAQSLHCASLRRFARPQSEVRDMSWPETTRRTTEGSFEFGGVSAV